VPSAEGVTVSTIASPLASVWPEAMVKLAAGAPAASHAVRCVYDVYEPLSA
jgi:hypothetical protein